MKFEIWSTPDYSLWQLSDALKNLRVSHSIQTDSLSKPVTVNCKRAQPKWVHLSSNVKDLQVETVNFISASYAELSYTNYAALPKASDLTDVLRYALQCPPEAVSPEVIKMSNLDYVRSVAKPSLLNNIQTMVYKIQPYALRKEVQVLILRYFKSEVSLRFIEHSMKRSLKTIGLVPLLRQGVELRSAVARLKDEDVESVATATGFQTFELLYLSKERKK